MKKHINKFKTVADFERASLLEYPISYIEETNEVVFGRERSSGGADSEEGDYSNPYDRKYSIWLKTEDVDILGGSKEKISSIVNDMLKYASELTSDLDKLEDGKHYALVKLAHMRYGFPTTEITEDTQHADLLGQLQAYNLDTEIIFDEETNFIYFKNTFDDTEDIFRIRVIEDTDDLKTIEEMVYKVYEVDSSFDVNNTSDVVVRFGKIIEVKIKYHEGMIAFPTLPEVDFIFNGAAPQSVDTRILVDVPMFDSYFSKALTKIEIPPFLMGLTGNFFNYHLLEKVIILPREEGFVLGACAFWGSEKLSEIKLPEDTQLKEYALAGISADTVILPKGITALPDCCFYSSGVKNLINADRLRIIGTECFMGAYLRGNKATLFSNVESIKPSAFCESMFDELVFDNLEYAGENAFGYASYDKITVGDKLANLTDNVFEGSPTSATIDLGKGIVAKGYRSLRRCNLILRAEIPPTSTYYSYFDTLKVPYKSLERYQNEFDATVDEGITPIELEDGQITAVFEGNGATGYTEITSEWYREQKDFITVDGYEVPYNHSIWLKKGESTVAFEECENVENMFDSIYNLKALFIDAGVEDVGIHFAYNASSLETVIFKEYSSIGRILDRAFAHTALKHIEWPNNLYYISGDAVIDTPYYDTLESGVMTPIGENGAYILRLTDEQSFTYPADTPYLAANQFYDTKVKEILFEDGFSCDSIPKGFLGNNQYVKNIKIPASVNRIEDNGFSGGNMLESIEFEGELTDMGEYTFSYATNLKRIILTNCLVPPACGNMFFNISIPDIYVPWETIDTYKTDTYWRKYASKIKAIAILDVADVIEPIDVPEIISATTTSFTVKCRIVGKGTNVITGEEVPSMYELHTLTATLASINDSDERVTKEFTVEYAGMIARGSVVQRGAAEEYYEISGDWEEIFDTFPTTKQVVAVGGANLKDLSQYRLFRSTNQGAHSSSSTLTLKWFNYPEDNPIEVYVGTDGEYNCDYVSYTLGQSTVNLKTMSNSSYITALKPSSSTADLTGTNTLSVVYRKDGSVNSFTDSGYLWIKK